MQRLAAVTRRDPGGLVRTSLGARRALLRVRAACGVCPDRPAHRHVETEASCFALPLGGLEDAGDGVGELRPLRAFGEEALFSCGGQFIDADALFVFGSLPVGGDPFLAFEAMQGWV